MSKTAKTASAPEVVSFGCRLNAYEYENTLRDLFASPWLQIRGLFPEDGEAHRFNKLAEALDVSHVHLARYMNAADHAIRQVLSAQWHRPPTQVKRYYAREQRTLPATRHRLNRRTCRERGRGHVRRPS